MLSHLKRKPLLYHSLLPAISLVVLLFIATAGKEKADGSYSIGVVDPPRDPINDTSIVTVAAILPANEGKSVQVIFNEKEQVFTLSREDKGFAEFNRYFENSLKTKSPLKIITDAAKGNFAVVTTPSAKEAEMFESFRKNLLKGDKAERIEITRIDTARFNIVDEYLKWPAFKLCTNVVPDYATAKKIFDYCAAQSCDIVGPHQVTPCIPFQYVIDGCYARAHKMRWIIENHFGYCSEKVFSFANQGNHRLAVQANKWGGCCVQWWFHVTPLIRVKSKFGLRTLTRAYVIDPGMFNEPVLLSVWLQAQENLACNANAHVDFYSIQPSSAYLPTYPTGAPFTTDPSYTQTNNTLIGYANGHTCN